MESDYDYVEGFLNEVSKLERCPAYLGSAMVEQIVDVMASTCFKPVFVGEGSVLTVLKWGLLHEKEPVKFARTFCLKTLRKYLESNISLTGYQNEVTKLLNDSLHFVTLEDLSLLNAIFLLLNTMKAENIYDGLRKDACDLAIRCIKDSDISLFVKKAACNYCKMLIEWDKSSLDLKSLIMSLYSLDDDFKCVADIFLCCLDDIDYQIASDLCCDAVSKRNFNFAYIKLLSRLFEKYPKLQFLFTGKLWHSERMKLSVLRDMISNGCSDVVPIVLSANTVTLADILPCLPYLSDKERESLTEQWIKKLNDQRKCAAEDVFSLLQLPWLSSSDYDSIFEVLKERIWSTPGFLQTMVQQNVEWCKLRELDIINCALEAIQSPDWEIRDAAVEVARILWQALHSNVDSIIQKFESLCCDDPNPFVRANVLRFLGEVNAKNVIEIAKQVYTTEVFSEPRLEAIGILDQNVSTSERWCVEVMMAAMNDSDIEIQGKAFSIAAQLMKSGGQYIVEVRRCLEEHVKNGSMWRNEINAILGNELVINNGKRTESNNNAVDLLKEALEKLKFPPDTESEQQVTMDCY
uniref:Cnd3 domain-containing protein n=1 Tax=Syphacia muris TaxID=451379 RepID=A0A0N5AJJ8_9BILA